MDCESSIPCHAARFARTMVVIEVLRIGIAVTWIVRWIGSWEVVSCVQYLVS